MDPITGLMILSGAAQVAGGGLSIAGKIGQMRSGGRQSRMQMLQISQNMEMASARSAFEQNRVSDQADQIMQQQTDYYTAGGLDPTWGSPAVTMAETEAAAEGDKMLVAARSAQERAEMAGQMAGVQKQADDRRAALGIGIATDALNTVTNLTNLAMQAQRFAPGAAAKPTTAMNIGPVGRGNTWATGGMGRW